MCDVGRTFFLYLFGFSFTYSYLSPLVNVLSFGKAQIYLAFLSFIRTFELARKYFHSEKLKFIWLFSHLFVPLQTRLDNNKKKAL